MDPASTTPRTFDDADLEDLLDDARRWERVRDPGMLDPTELVARVVGGLFGSRMDGAGGRFELAPFPPAGWKRLGLRRLRVHRTLVDIEVRPRAEWVTVRLAVGFGPPLATAVSLGGNVEVERVAVDEVSLGAPRAIFTARDEHEVTFFIR